MPVEPPIQNLEHIDVVGLRADNGVDLVIVASGPLDGSSDTLNRLDRKIRGYIREISSPAFRAEFPAAVPGKIRIPVVCEHAVDESARSLVEALKASALTSGATLELTDSVA